MLPLHYRRMAAPTGLEPAISSLTGKRFDQLSYGTMVVHTGLEPVVSCVRGKRDSIFTNAPCREIPVVSSSRRCSRPLRGIPYMR